MTIKKAIADGSVERPACWVQGIIQGVGFRPFVYRTAIELGLSGFVRNQTGSVYLEVEGSPEFLSEFATRLVDRAPRISRAESVHWQSLPPLGAKGFQIAESTVGELPHVYVSPDVATCDECLAELFDSSDRRYLYRS